MQIRVPNTLLLGGQFELDNAGSNFGGEFLFQYATYRRIYSSPSNPAGCSSVGQDLHPALIKIEKATDIEDILDSFDPFSSIAFGYGDSSVVPTDVMTTYKDTVALNLAYNQQGFQSLTVWWEKYLLIT